MKGKYQEELNSISEDPSGEYTERQQLCVSFDGRTDTSNTMVGLVTQYGGKEWNVVGLKIFYVSEPQEH